MDLFFPSEKIITKLAERVILNGKSVNIKKDENLKLAIISPDGKPSSLDYNIIGYDNDQTYVNISLHSGRYNSSPGDETHRLERGSL